jgi:septum formation inhibitor-activating ATPase MinD
VPAPAKGGTGKTSTALAVAEYLPRVREDLRVSLLDGDVFDGNVALSLGLHERARTILELAAVAEREGMTPEMLSRYMTATPWGFDFLAAPDSSLYRDGHLSPGVVDQTYDVFGVRGNDVVVTDAPPDIRSGSALSRAFFREERMSSLLVLLILGPRRFERDGFSRMADFLGAKGALARTWLVYVQTRPYRRSKDTTCRSLAHRA